MTTPPGKATYRRGSFWDFLRQQRDDLFRRPYFDYFNIMAVVLILCFIGIAMVMSASMTYSAALQTTAWSAALRQGTLVLIGFIAMWLAMRLPVASIRRLSTILLVISIVLLILVLIPGIGTGLESKGSQSWISVGPLQLQPSEIARISIAVWGAHILAGHKPDFRRLVATPGQSWLSHPYVKFMAVAIVMLILILLEQDIGMAMTFLLVVVALLFFAGIDLRFITTLGVVVISALAGLLLLGGFRSKRITTYIDALFGDFSHTKTDAFQSYQGFLSLADGGMSGVGIGQSRAKWFYLPEAKNDFIFAIVGEELGWLGGCIVIALFSWLGFIGCRIAMRSSHQFLSLMAATLTAGIVVQAFVNMGYVVGLLPVTGIQLPLISSGGTSAVITLGALGLLASCARHEPETISAMANSGRPVIESYFFLPEPSLHGLEAMAPRRQRQRQQQQRAHGRSRPRGEVIRRPLPERRNRRY